MSRCKNTGAYTYVMFDRKGNTAGLMRAFPETLYDKYRRFSPNADVYRSFFIDRLFSFRKGEGVGKAFINIAKKESFRKFCFGNVHTIASSIFDKQNPPYIFFRKMGFEFNQYSSHLKFKVDECIKSGSKKSGIYGDIPMYIEKCIDNTGKAFEKYFRLKLKFREIFE